MADKSSATTGVLVMSYGTPESMEQVEAYYTHIRGGRPPSEEQLRELTNRYKAIVGGVFPLREHTNKQVDALEKMLNQIDASRQFVCYQGLKHAAPFIEDGVQRMSEDGIQKAIGIVLAPHYSTMSVGSYMKRARQQAEKVGLQMEFVKSYHLHPQLIEAFAERVNETMQQFDPEVRQDVHVLFTAHSLPEKILEMDDPYVDQLNETAQAIAEQTNLKHWQFAWQSAGQTAMPWLGPDITEVLRNLASEKQAKQVLVCPIGFVSDHLEILYDIDIECQTVASEVGLELKRTASLNTDPRYIHVLADSVLSKLNEWQQ